MADSAGVFHTTEGLSAKFAEGRAHNTPISEEAIIAASIGAAMGR
jgi:pyruvate/2-oxoglutarate/acetoin dehydrogenase E1 component